MTATEPITPPPAAGRPQPSWDAGRDAHPAAATDPTFREIVDETLPLVEVVPVYGPPVVVVAAPWVFMTLILAGPFALMVTLIVVLVAAAALLGLIGAILAAPYLVVGHLRRQRERHASVGAPAAQVVAIGPPRVAA